ncbi:hypothetical protein BDW02DRAFT_571482 [Decorospora gaudefroyi]|uniref:Mitochondrial import inner membrane translocase subunit TIM50 n=1 Tax=Decorospora gaudefroyi TaxID=184978 RepID=A0A6A5KC49_9PLEO|nr:hypothetical protein BDW02DRAFT_571482 [Decorospora gaudefroyi]
MRLRLRHLHLHIGRFFTDDIFLVAQCPSPLHVLHGCSRVRSTTAGCQASSAGMNDQWNPHALPFRPGGSDGSRRQQQFAPFDHQLPPRPLPLPQARYGPPDAPWHAPCPPPPPPPPMYSSQQSYNDHIAHQQAQAYHQWMQYNGYNGHAHATPPPPPNFYPGPEAFAAPPSQYPRLPPYGHPSQYRAWSPFAQQSQPMFHGRAHHHTMQSPLNYPRDAMGEDIQAPTPPGKKPQSGPSTNGHVKQKETSKAPKPPAVDKGRYGDEKIMLPAPQPTPEYLDQAAGEPSVTELPGQLLVILDLNGTVLYRPNRKARTMIQRPFLKPFMRYLFDNFKVMVWSSAKPDNVKSLVSQSLEDDLRAKLVAQWARDSFGLSPTNYQQNVQVYKNLKLVWSRNQIQSYHPDYNTGGRFGQHNTVLIDDSAIKASAQPHNLLEIPEFSATPEQMEGDVLRVVAGYLETLRRQVDVSKFIKKEPFKDDGRWSFDWPDEAAGGGEMTAKVSAANASKKKPHKKKLARATAAAAARSGTNTPLSETTDTLASVSLPASMRKDW